MNTSGDGLDLIKEFEGYRARAYLDPVGIWTIGYGHTRNVSAGQSVTPGQAAEYLREDVREAEAAVDRLVKAPLMQHQYDALVSFVFNVGQGAFAKSTLLKRLNAGDYDAVPDQLARWVHGGGKVLPGLVRRRAAEAEMWQGQPMVVPVTPDPVQEKPLAKSRTMWGGGIAAAGIAVNEALEFAGNAKDTVQANAGHLEVLGVSAGTITAVVAVLALCGALAAMYARMDDRAKGRN